MNYFILFLKYYCFNNWSLIFICLLKYWQSFHYIFFRMILYQEISYLFILLWLFDCLDISCCSLYYCTHWLNLCCSFYLFIKFYLWDINYCTYLCYWVVYYLDIYIFSWVIYHLDVVNWYICIFTHCYWLDRCLFNSFSLWDLQNFLDLGLQDRNLLDYCWIYW